MFQYTYTLRHIDEVYVLDIITGIRLSEAYAALQDMAREGREKGEIDLGKAGYTNAYPGDVITLTTRDREGAYILASETI